jgi:predicted Zn-dependent protease
MGTDVEMLYEEALDLLGEGEGEAALERGRALADAGDPRGYELSAMALAELERSGEAVTVLERGTRAHPDRWLLWQLLGNALSDENRHDEALLAYDRALSLPDVDRDSVEYNRALSRARAGDPDRALAGLARLAAGPFALRAGALQVAVLRDRGRIDEALAAAAEAQQRVGPATAEVGGEGELLAELAETLFHGKGDRAGAERAARASLVDEAHPLAFEILRELRAQKSPAARFHRLTVEGRLPQGPTSEPVGFYRVYEVVADDADAAFRFAADVEVPEARASLRLEEHEAGEPAPDEWLGVLSASEYLCFDEVPAEGR